MISPLQEFEAGQAALSAGNPPEARGHFLKALDLLVGQEETLESRRLAVCCHRALAQTSQTSERIYHQDLARQLLQKLFDLGHPEIEVELATLEGELGQCLLDSRGEPVLRASHAELFGAAGADKQRAYRIELEEYQKARAQAQSLLQSAVDRFSRVMTAPNCEMGKALYHLGRFYQADRADSRAAELYRQAECVFSDLPESPDQLSYQAAAGQNLSAALDQCYQHQESIEAAERSAAVYQRLLQKGHWSHYGNLAQTWVNVVMSAYYLQDFEKLNAAAVLALSLLQDLGNGWKRPQFQQLSQSIQYNLDRMGWRQPSSVLEQQWPNAQDQAQLLTEHREDPAAMRLCWQLAAGCHEAQALSLYQLAEELYQVHLNKGRVDLVEPRAKSLLHLARIHQGLNQHEQALQLLQESLSVLKACNQAGRSDLVWEIVEAQALLAHSHQKLGQMQFASEMAKSCLEIVQAMEAVEPLVAAQKMQQFRIFGVL